MSNYDSQSNRQEHKKKSCKNLLNSKNSLGASSIFHRIKNNISNLIFLGKEDGIENKSKHILKKSANYLDDLQLNELNQVYDAPTLELNITNELEHPVNVNTNTNDYVNTNLNDTRIRKFSLDSSRINPTKKKTNPITRIIHYITEKKFETKEKNDVSMSVRNSSFTSKHSAFKPIDSRSKNINLNSKKIINYNDFFEVLKDKHIVKPIAVKKTSSEFSQIAKKRSRPLEDSFVLQEEEKAQTNGLKRRKLVSDDDRSLFSSVQNLNKIRNLQRDDVSMKSLNSVMSHKFIKEDKEKNIMEKNVNDDVSMNFIIPENKSVVKSYYSKTLDEIKSEIQQKRGKNLRMLDEISQKSRKSREDSKMEYDEKKKFLSNYYKEKEKNYKEINLLNKDGKISLDESDLNKDRNLSYSKSSMTIQSAPRKNKNVNIVQSSNFDICSNKEKNLSEEKDPRKEIPKMNQNFFSGIDKQIIPGDSNALTDKKINLNEKKSVFENNFSQKNEKLSPFFGNMDKGSDASKSLFGFGSKNTNLADEKKQPVEITPVISDLKPPSEKIQNSTSSGFFGIPSGSDLKSELFGNIEKKEESGNSTMIFGDKKEEKSSMFDKISKKEDTPGLFNLDKNQEKKDVNAGFFNIPEKNEEKPSLNVLPLEKKEEKPILFGIKTTEEQKTDTAPLSSLFNSEQGAKKTEPDQKSTLISPSFFQTTNKDDKIYTGETPKPSEEKSTLFPNNDNKPSQLFSFPTQINPEAGNNLGNTTTFKQSVFGNIKDDKESQPSPLFGNKIDTNKTSLFNSDIKPAESTPTNKLFGNIPASNQPSIFNESQKQPIMEASSSLPQKEKVSNSLVNKSNPFLKSYGGDKAPTIFQSPNKPGKNNFNFSKADGIINNPIPTPAFNSGIGMNKFPSSINNSNRSNDIFENQDKGLSNKGFAPSSGNQMSGNNPFFPKTNNPPKNDIFSTNTDSNDTMAISPIASPKMISKNDDLKNPNFFQSTGNFGATSTGFGVSGLFGSSAGSNVISNTMKISTGSSNNGFLGAMNNSSFAAQPSNLTVTQGNNGGLFSGFTMNTNNNINQPSTVMFGSTSTGSGLTFNLGKKEKKF